MPITIPNDLPAASILKKENIFVMTKGKAKKQDIRPLKILLVNLMPTKIETETQFSRLLGNTPLQIELELVAPKSHTSKHTSAEHLQSFYKSYDDIKENRYDGCIITGAPVEHLEFEKVDYWKELCDFMKWTKTHVYSTLYICWGAQAGLYYHYGIKKYRMNQKLFGIYKHKVDYKKSILFRGFDDYFYAPHSRYTYIKREDIEKAKDLKILASSSEAGVNVVYSKKNRQIFIMGHFEYDSNTLNNEYLRDVKLGKKIDIPINYYLENDPSKKPICMWRASANLLFSNWLNYFVYQSTPYDIDNL